MAHNKLYRSFIILQEDERGYSHSNDKALSGYAKVEAKGDKCKVSFYAQNLKQEDNYSMVLICCKRDLKQLIDLGPLTINGVGKGDASKEYYVNNIAGLGISYEKISGAAICKVNDNETEFIMHGLMSGEDSADNWRKFKVVKVDSKKYINTLDSGPEKKESFTSSVADKVVTPQANNVEIKFVKPTKLEDGLVERKEEANNIQSKGSIEVKVLNEDNSKMDDKQVNRNPENNQNIDVSNVLAEDRNKCKETKKHGECEKNKKIEEVKNCYKYEKTEEAKSCCKHEMSENIEEAINKLAKKLDTYDGVIDLRINNLHEDIIVYGFIKDKKNDNCKWKKFKVEKKCRNESQDFNNIQSNSKRIEENFKLDKLNETVKADRVDRLDIIDFDEYENDIQKLSSDNIIPKTTSNGIHIQQPSLNNTMQQGTQNQDFNMNGEVGQYFEKLAEGFEPYDGSLADINYCKLYKINVNSIEDLSDESNYNQYTLAYYPMLNYYPYISKEGYFLLGYKCNRDGEMQYIVYAVPGSKERNDQPYGGRTGFVTWTSDNKNGRGYWLMFYDFKNSSIVIPTK